MTIFLLLVRNAAMAEVALCFTFLTLAFSSSVLLCTWIKKKYSGMHLIKLNGTFSLYY